MANRDFIGRGVNFPLRFDPATGGVAKDRGTGGEQQQRRVRMSLQQILSVKKGEMFMARGFGSGMRDLIFQTDAANVEQRAEFAATRAIEDPLFGEHRIDLERVYGLLTREAGQLDVAVEGRMRQSNDPFNQVFPLYLQGAQREAAERSLSS